MLELILYVVVFVALSGLVAMVEAAILSVSRAEVEELVQQGRRGAVALRTLVERLPRALVIIVLITNTINILGPILAGNKAIELYGNAVIGLITAILTLATIFFSEIIPKSLGTHHAPTIGRVAAPLILALIYTLYPLVIALEWVVNQLTRGERPIGTEAQIRFLVRMGRRAGHIESDEGQLIQRAFVLNDKSTADLMTPLKDVVSVQESATIRQSAQRVFRTEYSRYPIFGESVDDVRGMALSRDILGALSEAKDNDCVTTIARPALVVSASMRSDALLALFRDRNTHRAVVQDEGHTVGLITLEDVLEELVGEIDDEKDVGP
jgi:putative hemolysin